MLEAIYREMTDSTNGIRGMKISLKKMKPSWGMQRWIASTCQNGRKESEQFRNSILPKAPSEVCLADTIFILKKLFNGSKSRICLIWIIGLQCNQHKMILTDLAVHLDHIIALKNHANFIEGAPTNVNFVKGEKPPEAKTEVTSKVEFQKEATTDTLLSLWRNALESRLHAEDVFRLP